LFGIWAAFEARLRSPCELKTTVFKGFNRQCQLQRLRRGARGAAAVVLGQRVTERRC
jgi:hypothetical protein